MKSGLAQDEPSALSVGFLTSDPIPFLATLAIGQFVGFVVVYELFLLGIPIEFPPEPITDIAELAERCGTVTGFDVSEG